MCDANREWSNVACGPGAGVRVSLSIKDQASIKRPIMSLPALLRGR